MSRHEVEDHGNGFMVIGTDRIKKARKVLKDYVDDVEATARFWLPITYEGRAAIWVTPYAGAVWDGAVDHTGKTIAR